MTDLVERLRERRNIRTGGTEAICIEAADEIARLSAEIRKTTEELLHLRHDLSRSMTTANEHLNEAERLTAELERYGKLDKDADSYWVADDGESAVGDWAEAVEYASADEGDIVEIHRGGVFETAFCASIGGILVKEATIQAAEAKVAELKARQVEEEA